MDRLDKLVSLHCNISRKEARQWIKAGRVSQDGQVLRDSGLQIPTGIGELCIDSKPLALEQHVYWMLNKPAGVLSASRDNQQATVLSLLPAEQSRRTLFPVGRLDKDTTGLLLLTDDGDFAHRLLSPRSQVYKTYHVRLGSPLTIRQRKQLEAGIALSDGTQCLPARVEVLADADCIALSICEGKYHQIKRMLAACGNRVVALHRHAIGGLVLDASLQIGECRRLSAAEREQIFA